MKRFGPNQCRRCGRCHDDVWQVVDPEGRWALVTVQCECGHCWTVIYTAPVNLAPVRAWIARGCQPQSGPAVAAAHTSWSAWRLEGVFSAHSPAAS